MNKDLPDNLKMSKKEQSKISKVLDRLINWFGIGFLVGVFILGILLFINYIL